MKTDNEQLKEQNTGRVIAWLQGPTGQVALADVKREFPNWSRHYSTLLGFTLGRHAHQMSYNTLDKVDLDQIAIAVFGETDAQRIQRERGGKGGSVLSDAKAEAARENGRKGGRPKKE